MPITSWIADERPREKLLNKGARSLADSELLAILLRTGSRGKTAVELARELLTNFGNLNNLLNAPQKKLCSFAGIGVTKFTQLQAAIEIARRQLHGNIEKKNILNNPEETKQYLFLQLQHYQQEVFACLFLDNRNHIICYEELFFGTINCSAIHPREILKKALYHNAAAVILAHNHPSGIPWPSDADQELTKQLTHTLALVDVRLLDHIIVGKQDCCSFVESRLLINNKQTEIT